MKIRAIVIIILAAGLAISALAVVFALSALDEQQASILVQEIRQSKDAAKIYPLLEELKDIYFKSNQFGDFIAALGPLSGGNKNLGPFSGYYTALSRYQQLKYLEGAQKWEEYFANNGAYQSEIISSLENVIKDTKAVEPLHIYARTLLFKFYRDRQDPLAENNLADLMNEAAGYAKEPSADPAVIKNTAGQLSSLDEKAGSRQLYKLYVEKLVGMSKDAAELKNAALGFYNEGNLELAEALYDAYIDRIIKEQGKAGIAALIEVARQFCYRDRGPNDPPYAEKVFLKIIELGGKEALNEELMYLRSFNLEKYREFVSSKDRYLELIALFPQSPYIDEAEFKAGIIFTYVLRDLSSGRDYFTKLSQKQNITPQVISSIYQLGLLAQWEGKNDEARQYYLTLKEKTKGSFWETVTLTNERLRELDQAQPLEYNLKTFLDVSLRPENVQFDRSKVDLHSHPYRSQKEEDVSITASFYDGNNGCMQPQYQYLWSGHIGAYKTPSTETSSADTWTLTKPGSDQPAFPTRYIHQGTKEINLVVVSSSGVIDRNLDMVDAYDAPKAP